VRSTERWLPDEDPQNILTLDICARILFLLITFSLLRLRLKTWYNTDDTKAAHETCFTFTSIREIGKIAFLS